VFPEELLVVVALRLLVQPMAQGRAAIRANTNIRRTFMGSLRFGLDVRTTMIIGAAFSFKGT